MIFHMFVLGRRMVAVARYWMICLVLGVFTLDLSHIYKAKSQSINCIQCIDRPDSPKTFPGICKGNFLCLQMISFEFLRVDSIG